MKKYKKALPYIIGILIPLILGAISGLLSRTDMKTYGSMTKPLFSPPAIVFLIAWSILYVIMGIASVLVWKEHNKNDGERGLAFYGFQLIFNFFWTFIFFSAKEYWFAFVWLLALLALVIVTTVYFRKTKKAAGIMMLPYLAWLVFAAYLNLGVAILN